MNKLLRQQQKRAEDLAHKREVKDLIDQVQELRRRQKFLDKLEAWKAPPVIRTRERPSAVREMTAVVLASDWHVEEPVDPEAIAGCNAYNLEIANRRIDRFFDAISWHISHQRASKRLAIRDLVLWLGGDLMTGYIHPELVEQNQLSPTRTIRWLLPRLRNGIATLLDTLKLDGMVIPCSYGNHGRTTDKSRISTGFANSYEWLMYHSLADEFRGDKRVRFEITNSPHQYVQVYNRTLHFHHGDQVKFNGGQGGLTIPLNKRIPKWDRIKFADVHNIGHYHQLLDLGRCVVNGSLIGYNSFAQSIGADFEYAQQAMYYIDSKMGKCQTTALWVQKPSDAVSSANSQGRKRAA